MRAANIQRGFSLVAAIFLLVVLAMLGSAMVAFSTAQSQSLALDVLGDRAYQAANAGIEWAAYNIATNPGANGANAFGPTAGNPLAGNLAPFDVEVSYTATAHIDAAAAGGIVGPVWTYDITARAVYGAPGTGDYVLRVITAKM